MNYFIYINGCVIVFKHTQVQIPFEYWDEEVKTSMETFDNIEVIKITQIASGSARFGSVEWAILDAKKEWKICVFQ